MVGQWKILKLKSFSSPHILAMTWYQTCKAVVRNWYHQVRVLILLRLIYTGINSRLVRKSVGSSLHKCRHEAQLHVMLFQESIFVSLPHLCDVAVEKNKKIINLGIKQSSSLQTLDLMESKKGGNSNWCSLTRSQYLNIYIHIKYEWKDVKYL